jgi:hypothetical protein
MQRQPYAGAAMRAALLLLALAAAPAYAQGGVVNSTPNAIDVSTLATKAEVAAKCDPMSSTPPPETVSGAPGSGTNCRLANAVQPRITRAATVLTDASCNFSSTWANALSAIPTISLTWVNTTPASGAIKCELTNDPTTTSAAGRCLREQPSTTLASVTIVGISAAIGGQTVNINQATGSSCSGIKVHVIALPPAS